MLQAGYVLNGRYEIIKMIGKGGMSVVYQARDTVNQNILAIKDVARAGEQDQLAVEQTLVTEANMLKQLSNAHLPKIYDIIENPNSFMMVMDYIAGDSLDKVIAREGAQPVDRVLNWGMQICEVFSYLHSQPVPIIYRDMKPANVILQPDGVLKMIDFGTARTQKVGVMMSADTLCLGTAGFAAPEQFGGIGQSTPRTDIFCLGATLYNLVTGHSPSVPPQGILPLERWNPALKNSPIEYIINKCTRNDPDARYQNAQELYRDLYAASVGNFRPTSDHGASGRLHRDFQKQNVKSSGNAFSAGLSGLLSRNRASAVTQPSQESPTPVVPYSQQTPPQAFQYQPSPQQMYSNTSVPAQQNGSVWKMLTKISLIVAVIALLATVMFVVLAQVLIGVLFMMIACGAAVLALIGVIFSRKSSG